MGAMVLVGALGAAMLALGVVILRRSEGAIHEVEAMVAIGLGLLTVAVALATWVVCDALKDAQTAVVAALKGQRPQVDPLQPHPEAAAAPDTDQAGTGQADKSDDVGQALGNWGGRRRLPDR